jgi:hypothetical protein
MALALLMPVIGLGDPGPILTKPVTSSAIIVVISAAAVLCVAGTFTGTSAAVVVPAPVAGLSLERSVPRLAPSVPCGAGCRLLTARPSVSPFFRDAPDAAGP